MKKIIVIFVSFFPLTLLAQYDSVRSDGDNSLIILGLILIIPLFILIARAIFSVGKRVRYQEAQFRLMVKLCQKQGVDWEDIILIMRDFNIPKKLPGDDQREFIKKQEELYAAKYGKQKN